jgi:hypothetical protein
VFATVYSNTEPALHITLAVRAERALASNNIVDTVVFIICSSDDAYLDSTA